MADPLIFNKNNPAPKTTSQTPDSNPKIENQPESPIDAKRRSLLHYQKNRFVSALAENAKYYKIRTSRARILSGALFTLVGTIYVYTIKRFGQEDFLDDNEPLQNPITL